MLKRSSETAAKTLPRRRAARTCVQERQSILDLGTVLIGTDVPEDVHLFLKVV